MPNTNHQEPMRNRKPKLPNEIEEEEEKEKLLDSKE